MTAATRASASFFRAASAVAGSPIVLSPYDDAGPSPAEDYTGCAVDLVNRKLHAIHRRFAEWGKLPTPGGDDPDGDGGLRLSLGTGGNGKQN